MARLHDLLGEYQESLRDAWARSVSCEPAGSSGLSDAHAVFASFFGELVSALRVGASGGAPPKPEEANAEESLPTVLDALAAATAFGRLHDRILEIAAERGAEVSLGEHRVLVSRVSAAVLGAVETQRRQHERELHRMAHQLRNPLGSAMMALTLLRSKVDLGEGTRLADMAERNLKKLEGLIDEAVREGESRPAPKA
jgi:signal transduction histidine kinase